MKWSILRKARKPFILNFKLYSIKMVELQVFPPPKEGEICKYHEESFRNPEDFSRSEKHQFFKQEKKQHTHKTIAEIIFTLTWLSDDRCRVELCRLWGHEFGSKLNFKWLGCAGGYAH